MPEGFRDPVADTLIRREERLRQDRATLDTLWQNIARYLIPRDASFTEELTPGVERNRFVLDSTAPRSLEIFAAFIHTLLNNPSSKWFNLVTADARNMKVAGVAGWASDAEDVMLAEFADANLYTHLHQIYLDLGAFGTSPLFVGWDAPLDQLLVQSYHMADIIISEDDVGRVDMVSRRFKFTPRQAQTRWPETDLGKKVNEATGRKLDEQMPFLHVVMPKTDPTIRGVIGQDDFPAPFVSIWINVEDRKVVQKGGFEEFPYMVPRWYKVRGELYGRSQAMTVMPDVRMVNRMSETILRGAEKIVDPPLMFPDGSLVSPVRLFPGGITFTEGAAKPEALIPPGASRIELGVELLDRKQQAIRDGFFTPLFMTPDSPVKTATQVLQEVDERNRALSPMLIRVQEELFDGLVVRAFNILRRQGKIDPPPPEAGVLRIDYQSPLVTAHKQLEGLALLRYIETLAPYAEVTNDPSVFDSLNPDKVGEMVREASGVPATVLRTQSEVLEFRQARQEAQQRQELQGQAPDLLKGIAALGNSQAAQTKAAAA